MTRNLHIEFKRDESKAPPNRVWVNSNDVTDDIRSAEVSMEASKVSSIPEVRAALLGFQRRLGCVGKTVLEGRDIGTIIFPDADLKLFLTASSEERAKRRLKDLAASGKPHPNLDELKVQIEKRDSDDSSRKVAPLKKASDAVELDTTNLNLDEVVEKAYQAAKAKGL
jgi:pantoate ligase / CMP/dCMP kinase